MSLTKEILIAKMDEFINISQHCWSEIDQVPWNEDNYLYELPKKFEISFYASDTETNQAVGVVINYLRSNDKSYGEPREDGRDYVFSAKLGVLPEYRGSRALTEDGQKVSYALFRRSIDEISKIGVPEFRFGVLPDNVPALKLFEKLGYQIIGKEIGTDNIERLVLTYYY